MTEDLFEVLYGAEFDYRFIEGHRKSGMGSLYTQADEDEARGVRDEARKALTRKIRRVPGTDEKQMIPYAYDKSYLRDDPRWYENQHPTQHDTSTATVWALHLNARPEMLGAILTAMSEAPETTGEYTYEGDSWVEWGTPTADLDDQHLAIYFRSKPEDAAILGASLATQASEAARTALHGYDTLTLPLPHHVSTAGDYAEQVK